MKCLKLLIPVLFFSSVCWADDVVHFKNGEVRKGQIIEDKGMTFEFRVDDKNAYIFGWGEVERVDYDEINPTRKRSIFGTIQKDPQATGNKIVNWLQGNINWHVDPAEVATMRAELGAYYQSRQGLFRLGLEILAMLVLFLIAGLLIALFPWIYGFICLRPVGYWHSYWFMFRYGMLLPLIVSLLYWLWLPIGMIQPSLSMAVVILPNLLLMILVKLNFPWGWIRTIGFMIWIWVWPILLGFGLGSLN